MPSHRLPIAIIAAKIWRSNLTGSLTQPNGGLYQFTTDHTVGGGGYLIETHPAFANLNNWRGSDYVLQQLNNDPDVIFKRLGITPMNSGWCGIRCWR